MPHAPDSHRGADCATRCRHARGSRTEARPDSAFAHRLPRTRPSPRPLQVTQALNKDMVGQVVSTRRLATHDERVAQLKSGGFDVSNWHVPPAPLPAVILNFTPAYRRECPHPDKNRRCPSARRVSAAPRVPGPFPPHPRVLVVHESPSFHLHLSQRGFQSALMTIDK